MRKLYECEVNNGCNTCGVRPGIACRVMHGKGKGTFTTVPHAKREKEFVAGSAEKIAKQRELPLGRGKPKYKVTTPPNVTRVLLIEVLIDGGHPDYSQRELIYEVLSNLNEPKNMAAGVGYDKLVEGSLADNEVILNERRERGWEEDI